MKKTKDAYRPLVLFTGFTPRWFGLLESSLAKRFSNRYRFQSVLWPSTWGERLVFVKKMRKADVIVLMDMEHEFDSTTTKLWLNWFARQKNRAAIHYWTGTEAKAFAEKHSGRYAPDSLPKEAGRIVHLTASDVLTETLNSVGLSAKTVVFPSPERDYEEVPPLPQDFSVLGYWTDNRASICGAEYVIEAARQLPDVPFVVIGATGVNIDSIPPNVSFEGFFEETGQYLREAVLHIRQFEYDAAPGATIEEALYFGRYALYTYKFPFTDYVGYGDVEGLVTRIRHYQKEFASGKLKPNVEGRAFIEEFWDPEKRFNAIIQEIDKVWATAVDVHE